MARLVPAVACDPHEFDELRLQVRQFITEEQQAGRIGRYADSWLTGWDEGFSRALAARGWLGMTAPVHGRSSPALILTGARHRAISSGTRHNARRSD